jgi:hypothetical protein
MHQKIQGLRTSLSISHFLSKLRLENRVLNQINPMLPAFAELRGGAMHGVRIAEGRPG